ncbi:MAG: hypothetical protein E6I76_19920 [Chloroflexi bacterium]|nr:MAG: hypothetical protein E6I76_19920 [Chloroflexota bacterium]
MTRPATTATAKTAWKRSCPTAMRSSAGGPMTGDQGRASTWSSSPSESATAHSALSRSSAIASSGSEKCTSTTASSSRGNTTLSE